MARLEELHTEDLASNLLGCLLPFNNEREKITERQERINSKISHLAIFFFDTNILHRTAAKIKANQDCEAIVFIYSQKPFTVDQSLHTMKLHWSEGWGYIITHQTELN